MASATESTSYNDRRNLWIRSALLWLLLWWVLFETTGDGGVFSQPRKKSINDNDGKLQSTQILDAWTVAPTQPPLPKKPPSERKFRWSTAKDIPIEHRTHPMSVSYQCEGPGYDDFTQKLRIFVNEQIETGKKHALWGQRGLPPNKWLLLWGNSHTRQIGNSLVSQHAGEIIKVKVYDPNINKNMARRFDLTQNRSVWIVANSYVAYSPDWVNLLQKQIAKRLWKIAALVVGTFNTCNAPVHTSFADEMEEISAQMAGVDCDNVEGPSVADVAKEYSGPLAYASMFSTYRSKDIKIAHDMMTELQNEQEKVAESERRPLAYVDARNYIRTMGIECGSPLRNDVSDCINNATAARYYHRCTGGQGGHADLIAWDLIDFVWDST